MFLLFLCAPHAVDGRQSAIDCPDVELVTARLHVFLEFALDALQCIVDGFDLTMQVDGDLLIGFAVEVAHEDAPLKVAEDFLHFLLDVDELLVTDDELLGVADARTGEHVEQGAVGVLVVDGLVQ